jgi:hypothetical protein
MSQEFNELSIRVGFFSSAAAAEQAIRSLRGAGFTDNEIAVICPEGFAGQIAQAVPKAKEAGTNAAQSVVAGGAVGAVLGGLGLLAATAVGVAGAAIALPVLVGGGAIAGGFSGLILADGYDKGVGDYYDYAIANQKIAVGVEIHGKLQAQRLAEAERILKTAGGAEPLHAENTPAAIR